ncbi:MAG TPA: GNAT family N-acetyltransferase [Xanthobacteraceae bacterium]|nr:GNAT family N-acetyltransferase [Xanthobacteraceae bacterium]
MALTFLLSELPLAVEALTSLESLSGAVAAFVGNVKQRHADARVTVETVAGPDAIAASRNAWQSLELRDGRTTPFQSFPIAAAAAEAHLRKGETPIVATVYRGGQPVVLFAAVIGRFLGSPAIRFLGDPLIQYGDMLASRSAQPADFAAAWRAVCHPRHAHFVQLRKVRSDAHIAPFLNRLGTSIVSESAPFLDLARPVARAARDARELRRLRRRLAEQGEVSFHVLYDEEALPALDAALAQKRIWLAERGLSSPVIGDGAWERALAQIARSRGRVRLVAAELRLGDRAIATEIALDDGERWCAYLGATDPQFAAFGPGRIQMADTIDHCAAHGRAVYDLLAPADAYKKSIATDACEVRDHAVTLGLRGRVGQMAIQAAPVVKAQLMRLPPGPRTAILGWLRNMTS